MTRFISKVDFKMSGKNYNMTEISEDILKNLKCSECDCYLSCSPVMLKFSGEYVCGRCSTSEEFEPQAVRARAYEELAKLVKFPCKYNQDGCSEKLPWNQIRYHEEACDYYKYECPVLPLGSCHWTGYGSKLMAHFARKHPQLITSHPCTFKPSITDGSTSSNFLMSACGYLFLVQIKSSMTVAKINYCVRLLGDAKLASLFEYSLEISSEKGNLVRKKDVASYVRYTMEKDNFIETNINSLLGNLGDYQGVSYTLTVQPNHKKILEIKCVKCAKNINSLCVFYTFDGCYCEKCKPKENIIKNLINFEKESCENEKTGCRWRDLAINMPKHQKWLCMFAKKFCFICKQSFETHPNLIKHVANKHMDGITMTNTIIKTALYDSSFSRQVLIYEDSMFLCSWKFWNNTLQFKVISDISKTANSKFICKLKAINPNSGYSKEIVLTQIANSLNHDWFGEIENDYERPILRKEKDYTIVNDVYDIEFEIVKEKTKAKSFITYKLAFIPALIVSILLTAIYR